MNHRKFALNTPSAGQIRDFFWKKMSIKSFFLAALFLFGFPFHFNGFHNELDGHPIHWLPTLTLSAERAFADDDTSKAAKFLKEANEWYDKEEFGKARIQYLNAWREDPANPKIHLGLGNAHLRLGDIAPAEYSFQNAIELGGSLPEAYLGLGFVALKNNHPKSVCGNAAKAENLGYSGAELFFLKAECRLLQSKAAEIDPLIKKGLAAGPDRRWKLVYAADIYKRTGDYESAASAYERLLAQFPDDDSIVVSLAAAYRRAGAFDKAKEGLDNVLKRKPHYLPALAGKADILLAKGDVAAGIKSYEQIAKKFTANPYATLRLAELFLLTGDLDECLKLVGRVLDRFPREPTAHLLAAKAYHEGQDYASVIQHCRQGLKGNANRTDFYPLLASALIGTESYVEAEVALDKGLELTRGDSVLYRMKCLIPSKKGLTDEAFGCIEEFAELKPLSPVPDMMNAEIFAAQKRFGKSIESYEKALRKSPEDPRIINNLAYMLLRNGEDLERAEKLALKAMEMVPEDPVVADTLGSIYFRQGEYEKAATALSIAAGRISGDPGLRYRLGVAYYETGRIAQGEAELTAALNFEEEFSEKEKAEALLSKIKNEK